MPDSTYDICIALLPVISLLSIPCRILRVAEVERIARAILDFQFLAGFYARGNRDPGSRYAELSIPCRILRAALAVGDNISIVDFQFLAGFYYDTYGD